MKTIISALLAGSALCISGSAIADDSSAALGMGGVQLTQSADIRMANEDLRISPKEVRISFTFVNESGKDIDTMVAFPLPDIDTYKFWGEAIGTITKDPVNFVGFKVTADGRNVPVQVEQRAIYQGRDVTSTVRAAGLPVNMMVGDASRLADNLSKYKLAMLLKAGLVEHDATSGVSSESPNGSTITKWLVRTKFYWTQHFPAGKPVVLEQSYEPVTGQFFFTDSELNGTDADEVHARGDYCIDSSTKSAIASKIAASKKSNPQNGGLLNAYNTDYVLVTGNNWKGPIGQFHLTVDKLKPDNILSMCWDGELRKTGPTTFESVRENFAPKQDIHLLVLEQPPAQ